MGKELNAAQVALLKRDQSSDITGKFSSGNLTTNFEEAKSNLPESGSIFVRSVNSSLTTGYTILPDLLGKPAVILQVSLQRNIYDQGVSTVNAYLVLIATCIGVFGLSAFAILERGIISRVDKITTSVSKISDAGDVGQRGFLRNEKLAKSNDEVSTLTRSINQMLDRIQKMTEELNKSQRFAAIGELSVMVARARSMSTRLLFIL